MNDGKTTNDPADLACILRGLPAAVSEAVRAAAPEDQQVTEIRLRAGRVSTLTLSDGGNTVLKDRSGTVLSITAGDIRDALLFLSGGSVYAHRDTLRSGFITCRSVRTGIGGRAAVESGNVRTLSAPTSLCIRIPADTETVSSLLRLPTVRRAAAQIAAKRSEGGALIFSVPGGGKTTLLKALTILLSDCTRQAKKCLRTVIIDTRGELYTEKLMKNCAVDVLEGYPPAAGIETAVRSLSPELIVCDEIGSERDAEAMLAALNSGTAFLSSAHAPDAKTLYRRPAVRRMLEGNVYSLLIGISGPPAYSITVTNADGSVPEDQTV